MSVKIIKATGEQKIAYLLTSPVHPLYGYIEVDGVQCAVEDLFLDPDVKYEVIAPTGYKFDLHDLHNVLGRSLQDVLEQMEGCSIVKCERPCEWCGAGEEEDA